MNFLISLMFAVASMSLQISYKAKTTLASAVEMRDTDCDSALAILQNLQDTLNATENESLGKLHEELGLTYYCLGDYSAALTNYLRCIELYELTGNDEGQVLVWNLVGTLHKKQGDFDLAKEYFQKGLALAKEHGNNEGIGNSLNNIGIVHFQSGEIEQSLSYYLASTRFKEKAFDTLGLSYNFDNLGQVYSQLNDLDSAVYYFKKALEYKEIVGEKVGFAIVQNNLAEAFLAHGSLDRAERYFEKALLTARKAGYAEFEKHIILMLSKVNERQNRLLNALDYFKRYVAINDSLFNVRKAQVISDIQTKYETEKKEQQIALQQSELAEQRAQNQRNIIFIAGLLAVIVLLIVIALLVRSRLQKRQTMLRQEAEIKLRESQIKTSISSQERERTRFAKDLHDGFGQMISLLNLNLSSLREPSTDRHEIFDQSSRVLDEMYQELKNICFNLMPQTLIKNGIDVALQEFAGRINAAGKIYISVNVFGLDSRLSELHEISLYRVTQEWINNILKYSDATKVTVQITRDDEEVTLLIEDDGMGFAVDRLRSGKGNGWRNINTRANLINGELIVETAPGIRGNTMIINAPAKEKSAVSEEKIPI